MYNIMHDAIGVHRSPREASKGAEINAYRYVGTHH